MRFSRAYFSLLNAAQLKIFFNIVFKVLVDNSYLYKQKNFAWIEVGVVWLAWKPFIMSNQPCEGLIRTVAWYFLPFVETLRR
jgi:hypothetical protein